MVRILSALAAILPLVSAASQVLDLIPSNFDNIVFDSGKPALVEFFAPWCGHCKTLAPVYEELGAAFASSPVSIAKVDADEHRDLGKRFGVQGFPTLKWFDGKSKEPTDYNGGRDLESLTSFITEKTGMKTKKKAESPSQVQVLTDANFKETIGFEKHVLVAFTAPWCGHCKSLAPIWEKLASTFSSEANVVIAKVDAEAENSKSTAESFGVTSYPTIKFFNARGTIDEPYEGARSEDAFVAYINAKAGTHRLPGGNLDLKAGTIAALDAVLQPYLSKSGISDAAAALAAVKEAAVGLKDSTAEYYVKALGKAVAAAGYPLKEQTRLQGILKKGGLSQEKVDDLTRRSNILGSLLYKDKDLESEADSSHEEL